MKRILILLVITAVITIGIISLVTSPPQNTSAEAKVVFSSEIKTKELPLVIETANFKKTTVADHPGSATPVSAIQKTTRQKLVLQLAQAIKAALISTNAADHDLVYTNLLPALIAMDPATAGQLAEGLEAGDGRQEFLRRVAQDWAAVDTNGVVTWAANLTDPNERTNALTDAAFQIAQSDPAAAIALAASYAFGGRNATLENLAQIWAGQDLASAVNWAAQQPAGDQRDQVFARIAFVQSQTSPEAAANLIVNQMAPGSAQNEAAMSVLHQWALQDFAAASAWVNQFPAGPLADRARQELAGIAAYRQAQNH